MDHVCGKLDRILDALDRNFTVVTQVKHMVEMILVQMESQEDVKQMSGFFTQRVAEGLDHPLLTKTAELKDSSRFFFPPSFLKKKKATYALDQQVQLMLIIFGTRGSRFTCRHRRRS